MKTFHERSTLGIAKDLRWRGRAGLLAATYCFALTAAGEPHAISLVNLQPVDAQSIIETPYDPTVASADVLFEPWQVTAFPFLSYRTNMDFEVRNDESEYLRIDRLRVHYPGYPQLQIENDQLLGYGAGFYSYAPADSTLQRTALAAGGFGLTGLVQQEGLSSNVPFGRALDVVAYQPPARGCYAVVGSPWPWSASRTAKPAATCSRWKGPC